MLLHTLLNGFPRSRFPDRLNKSRKQKQKKEVRQRSRLLTEVLEDRVAPDAAGAFALSPPAPDTAEAYDRGLLELKSNAGPVAENFAKGNTILSYVPAGSLEASAVWGSSVAPGALIAIQITDVDAVGGGGVFESISWQVVTPTGNDTGGMTTDRGGVDAFHWRAGNGSYVEFYDTVDTWDGTEIPPPTRTPPREATGDTNTDDGDGRNPNNEGKGNSHVSWFFDPDADLRISIAPNDVNEVGDSHTFTVFVEQNEFKGAGWVPAAGTTVSGLLDGTNGAIPDIDGPGAGPAAADPSPFGGVTGADGKVSVSFTSATAGVIIGSATATKDFNGQIVSTSTTDADSPTGNATKREVDAYITIAPDDTNAVGKTHRFIATVYEDTGDGIDSDGDGSNFDPAANETVAFTLTNSNGANFQIIASDLTTDANGEAWIDFTSPSAGIVTGSASSNVSVFGLSLFRTTDGSETTTGSGTFNSDPADKQFIDVRISIDPDGDNVVGLNHLYDILLERTFGDNGTPLDPTDDWAPFAGQHVTASFVGAHVGSFVGSATQTTNASGIATVSTTSSLPGTDVVKASWSGDVYPEDGVGSDPTQQLMRMTGTAANTALGGSGNATKDWYVGRIILTPATALNGITEPHTINAFVQYTSDAGATTTDAINDTSWLDAPDGTTVQFSLPVNPAGAATFVSGSTGSLSGGTTSVQINSNTAVTVEIAGQASFMVGGVLGTFNVMTDPSLTDNTATFSGPRVEKVYVAADLFWIKHNHLGQELGGATFEVQRIADRFGNPVSDAAITVLDNSPPDADPDDGQFLLVGLPFGTYTIKETIAPDGFFLDPAVVTAVIDNLSDPSFDVSMDPVLVDGVADPDGYIWVNVPGRDQLTPTGTSPDAFLNGTAQDLVMTVNKEGNIAPGRLFYYNLVKANSPTGTTFIVTVSSNPDADPDPEADGAKVWYVDQNNVAQKADNQPGVTIDINKATNTATIFVPANVAALSPENMIIMRVEYNGVKKGGNAGTVYTFKSNINGNDVFTEDITVLPGLHTAAIGTRSGDVLTQQQLQQALEQAASYWGLDAGAVPVQTYDFEGTILGAGGESGIYLDLDAAGHGWSIGAAPGRIDLVSTLAHEFGHALGHDHDDGSANSIMYSVLTPGASHIGTSNPVPAATPTIVSSSILSAITPPVRGADVGTLLTAQPETALQQPTFIATQQSAPSLLLPSLGSELQVGAQDTTHRLASYLVRPEANGAFERDAFDLLFAENENRPSDGATHAAFEVDGEETQESERLPAEAGVILSEADLERLFAESAAASEQAVERLFAGEDVSQPEETSGTEAEVSGAAVGAAALFGTGLLLSVERNRSHHENRRNGQQPKPKLPRR